jgi:Uma2 family endonuclease
MPDTMIASPSVADDRFEYPYEQKEMQSDKHAHIFMSFGTMLMELFKDVPDAHVGGDQAFYWTPRVIADVIVPDAHVLRGVDKSPRDSIRLFEERDKFPDFRIAFVMEIWSKDNPMRERYAKYDRYRRLGASEYLEYDAKTDELVLHRLGEDGFYQIVEPNDYRRLYSKELNVELVYEDGLIRFYRDNQRIPTVAEAQAALLAKDAALLEKDAALKAAQLEIERLKAALAEKQTK